MLAEVLLDMHNTHHYQRFMSQVRDEIEVGCRACSFSIGGFNDRGGMQSLLSLHRGFQ